MNDKAPAPEGATLIEKRKRVVYYSPSAGRSWLSKRAAYRGEARARFYSFCECEAGGYDEPGSTCELHLDGGKYKTHRDDGTTLTGRILRRWTAILIANDRRVTPPQAQTHGT